LEKLASVDSFLTEVNEGERPLGRKRSRGIQGDSDLL
jgi:hypothetical protein